jgi:hypothetical protein
MSEAQTAPQETRDAARREALYALAQETGFFEQIDTDHTAYHVLRGDTLLVTCESGETLWGPEVARAMDASLLLVHADGPTWYRAKPLHDFMDALTDEGFFDDFDRVLFAGAGMGAYGAAVFSVAAPGSQVLLIQPVATLEPARVPWEPRNRAARALSWAPRYSFGPEAVEGADHVTVLSDPTECWDAMHASLYQGRHVTHLRAPHGGKHLLAALHGMAVLDPVVSAATRGRLTQRKWAQLWRARRDYGPYLRALLAKLDTQDRPRLTVMLCENVLSRMNAPAFRRRLQAASEKLATDKDA